MQQDPLVAAIASRLRTLELDGETFYLAEGDLLVAESELEAYALRRGSPEPSPLESHGLVAVLDEGRVVRWRPGTVLSYCVLKATFDGDDQYREVVANMSAATRAWEEACGVEFRYRPSFDGAVTRPPSSDVVFVVRGVDTGGKLIAVAFFPTQPEAQRMVRIDPSYFTTDFDRVGVLRHELGHVLGFRHEHIRSGAPPECPAEATANTLDLTRYDPTSVMHYFCGDVGSRDLELSPEDVIGAQRVYGFPLTRVRMVDV